MRRTEEKHMRKKLTWIFLVLVLVLCVKPMRVKAADEDYTYIVNEDGETITITMYVQRLSAKHRTNLLIILTMKLEIILHSISIITKIPH